MTINITKEAYDYVIKVRDSYLTKIGANRTPIIAMEVPENSDGKTYIDLHIAFDTKENIPSNRFMILEGNTCDVAQYLSDYVINKLEFKVLYL